MRFHQISLIKVVLKLCLFLDKVKIAFLMLIFVSTVLLSYVILASFVEDYGRTIRATNQVEKKKMPLEAPQNDQTVHLQANKWGLPPIFKNVNFGIFLIFLERL